MKKHLTTLIAASGFALFSLTSSTLAGPFILSGTDSDDHGSASATANLNGWLFMQKAIQNIATGVTNGNKSIAVLGSASTALAAAQSAFNFSGLSAAGWTLTVVDTAANLTNFFNGTAAYNISNAGILMMDSSSSNVSGGADAAELGVFTTNALTIDAYLGAGGGLFSQANDFGWASALLPSLVTVDLGGGGNGDPLSLTAAGNAAFPGLTNGDLSTGPYHNIFTNPAGLPILAVNTQNQAVIIGAFGGTVTNPNPPGVPDSGATIAMLGLAFTGIAGLRRKFAV
jgi:hypothetical protein